MVGRLPGQLQRQPRLCQRQPSNAKWFLDNTLIGDPIIITGSPRVLEPMNGWGHWQESWRQWLEWSSLKHFNTEDV
ncbi:hypothetical protein GCM10018952_33810 [Streptosporangium vulgare]